MVIFHSYVSLPEGMIFMGKTLVSKGPPGSCRQVKNLKAAKLEVLHAKQHWEAGIQQENQKDWDIGNHHIFSDRTYKMVVKRVCLKIGYHLIPPCTIQI